MKLISALLGALLLACSPAIADTTDSPWAAGVRQAQVIVPLRKGRRVREPQRIELAQPLDIRSAPQIVAEAARYIGTRNPMAFRGPGCKAFVNMVARRAGYFANASMRALDTAGMGQRIDYPVPGAYRVSYRRGGGHTEIVASVDGGTVTTINGNKGRNRVGWSHRSIGGARYYLPLTTRLASL